MKMLSLLARVLLLPLALVSCASLKFSSEDFPYKTGYFSQPVDHFNQMSYGDQTFQMKYLYQDKYWKKGSGPIFFYTGNEGAIEDFWGASGLIHQMAPEFEALVLFAEHRYYGSSLPFGKKSFERPYLGLLTIPQAMADFATFLTAAKTNINATNCKVIAFGGSYGGMLSAYMRFKYPNLIDGALAASAPIYMQAQDGPHDFFFSHVTQDFRAIDEKCYTTVKEAFVMMKVLAEKGQTGLDQIATEFSLCDKLNSTSYQHLLGWVRNAFTLIAMLDYPYPTSFMGHMPANPVKVGCEKVLSGATLMRGLAEAAGVYYNGTGSVKCYDIYAEFVECADPTGCGTGNDAIAWDYQACTDIILPAGSNNATDMFPVLPWTPELREDYCKKQFGITTRPMWPEVEFWGLNIATTSNIIFSNGDLDPWRGGGVLSDVSSSVRAMTVKGGAHHLDLRASNPADPPGVVEVREMERTTIRKWINS